jgi:negative regulator of genetic competence, sporulation and motility
MNVLGGHAPMQQGNDEDSTPLRRDDVEPIVVDRSMLINDEANNEENETTYDDEEELSSNDDTNSAHEEELSLSIIVCLYFHIFLSIVTIVESVIHNESRKKTMYGHDSFYAILAQ